MAHQWIDMQWHASPPPLCERTRFSRSHRSFGQHHPTVRGNELLSLMRANVITAIESLLPRGHAVAPCCVTVKQQCGNQAGGSELDSRPAAVWALKQMDHMEEDKSLWSS